jgi:CrcB protein
MNGFGMQIGILLAVALGGATGSLLRYFVASAIQTPASAGFPWGIFVVNVTGGFFMGLIVELSALKLNLSPELRAFLTVGILGGYTTFSTFSLDSVLLLQRGAYAAAGAYILGSTLLSIAALFAGLYLVRAFHA